MATSLSVSGNSRLTYSFSDSPTIGSLGESVELKTSRTVGNGTGAGEANVAWRDRVSITAGQVYSLNLLNLGATAFGFGGKVVINTLKEFFLVVNTTTTNRYVLVGAIGPSDTTGYSARVNRGGDYRVSDYQDGWTVTNAVNNIIYIANPSGGTVSIDLLVVGVGSTVDT
jgi:hypothetical protein